MTAVRKGQLTDAADAALALTPEERGQVEAALERVKTDFRDWVLAHVERSDTTDEVLARYTLPKDPAVSQSISNAFTVAVYGALGRERAELVLPTAQDWRFRGFKVIGAISRFTCHPGVKYFSCLL